jgi:hypothetical protein
VVGWFTRRMKQPGDYTLRTKKVVVVIQIIVKRIKTVDNNVD